VLEVERTCNGHRENGACDPKPSFARLAGDPRFSLTTAQGCAAVKRFSAPRSAIGLRRRNIDRGLVAFQGVNWIAPPSTPTTGSGYVELFLIKSDVRGCKNRTGRVAGKRNRAINLPAPYLRRIWLDRSRVGDTAAYPFCLPFLARDFELGFDRAITIVVGENGTGKSTLLEGIAALAGYDDAGGGKGYRPVDHTSAIEAMGGQLAQALRASWLPKITNGWFFRAESFFSVARRLDQAALEDPFCPPPPDFLSHSHGEGFLRFFEERCRRQGIFIFDEPESALSPSRQIAFLKLLRRMEHSGICQVIMATHAPMLMAYPGARLLHLSKSGLEPVLVEDTEHYRLMREFWSDPAGFVETMLDE
jgi:predicted ATPase